MPKYEIMLVIDDSIAADEVLKTFDPIVTLFDKLPDYKHEIIANDTLAYPIKKKTTAHRCILNFVLDDKTVLVKFREQAAINKFLLRHLIINVEKDYGYRAIKNPKKIKSSQIKQEKFQKYLDSKELKIQKLAEKEV